IHGKGLGSAGGEPVLRSMVHSWLVQKDEVIAFCVANKADGGYGALIVLLKAALDY
ncbi:MAG: Smr/MutS family protein, partial [Telluria sp.]